MWLIKKTVGPSHRPMAPLYAVSPRRHLRDRQPVALAARRLGLTQSEALHGELQRSPPSYARPAQRRNSPTHIVTGNTPSLPVPTPAAIKSSHLTGLSTSPDFSRRVGSGRPVVLCGVVWCQRRVATARGARLGGQRGRVCAETTCAMRASKGFWRARGRDAAPERPGRGGRARVQRSRVTIGADSRAPARRAPRADSRSRGRARLCAPSRESARRS